MKNHAKIIKTPVSRLCYQRQPKQMRYNNHHLGDYSLHFVSWKGMVIIMNNKNEMNKKFRTVDLVFIALGAVFIAICSWISIPTTVPFTMQTFAIFLVLAALGGKRGTVAIILYILLGVVGIPVFSRFTSGIGVLLGSTGGYIVGFIFIGFIYWLTVRILGKKLWVEILAMVIGLAVCYSFGTVWFMIVYAGSNGPVGIAMVLSWCVIPFIIPDLIKLGLALTLARRLSRSLSVLEK